MYTLLTLMLLSAQPDPALAQTIASEVRAITHADLWQARRLGPPLLSPDGNSVLVSLVEPSYDPALVVSDLWLLSTDGRLAARRLTASKTGEATPVFSPDGQRIAFASQREGDTATQIYQLDLAQGGEAQPITRSSAGARSPQYAPDGKSILFISSVYPEADGEDEQQRIAAERKARKYNVRVYTGFPIRNWDKWLDERQQRVFVQALDGTAARDLLAGSALVKQPGFGGRFTDTAEELDAVWAPDGQSVVFAASINRNTGAHSYTHSDLYRVSLDGGEPVRLTPGDGLQAADNYSKPRFAADGKTLYALVQRRTAQVYNASLLASFGWPSFRAGPVFSAPDQRGVSSFAISPDSRTVFFLSEDSGQEVLFRSPARAFKLQALARQPIGVFTNLSAAKGPRGVSLVANFDATNRLPEIVLLDPTSGLPRAISGFNQSLQQQLDLPAVEHVWTESARGKQIHSLLIKPAGFDPARKYPLLVLLHGGPHGQWRDSFGLRWNYSLIAGREFVLLLTNFSGSTGFGEAFAQSIQGDPLAGPADEINDAADEVIARFGFIDGARQCAGGASYGGHLANWLQATTTRYRCLISHAGLVNLEAQWGTSDLVYSREANMGGPPWALAPVWSAQNPIRYADKFQTPTLVTIGEQDFRVPLNNSLEYWSALQRQQVESRLLVFPDENHWILKGENSRYFYAEVDAWLRRWLLSPK
jgi:dipeptidyl aminopeptidase/acylaminoacyl peptidase